MIDHEVKKQIRPGIANVDIAKSTFDHYDKNKDGGVTLNEFIPQHVVSVFSLRGLSSKNKKMKSQFLMCFV
jgi:hypothetical protein